MVTGNDSVQKIDFDVIIVGGGLAGLVSAILLSRAKKKVLLVEKKSYPFHKVCGEYVSNEVLPFLKSLGFDPFNFGASSIKKLRISSPTGRNYYIPLGLGGFGLSRYVMDEKLYEIALTTGAEILTNSKVTDITYGDNIFRVEISPGKIFYSKLVIGSYGKRDSLDKKLNRSFISRRTGYIGVKYHIRTDYPCDEIGLDNFDGGYCGIGKIEDDKYNLCYLYKRNSQIEFNSVRELEERVLFKNPFLKNILKNSTFVFDQPNVINEISFAPKEQVTDHIFMCGDSAGLITPVCGNGMSMAIHSASLLASIIIKSGCLEKAEIQLEQRTLLEREYIKAWKKNFSIRLFFGRALQQILGKPNFTGPGIRVIHAIPSFEQWLVDQTHGKLVETLS